MKKLFIALSMVIAALLTSCGSNTQTAMTTPSSSPSTNIVQVDSESEEISVTDYLSEFQKRTKAIEASPHDTDGNATVSFLTQEEQIEIQKMGYTLFDGGSVISKGSNFDPTFNNVLFYPIISDKNGTIELLGIDEYGDLYSSVSGAASQTYLHSGGTKISARVIMSSPYGTLYYEEPTGIIQLWSYGNLADQSAVPVNSIYAGHSYWEGYLFRNGNDMYAVKLQDGQMKCELIAHNVAQVLCADFAYTSDCWSQPLLLMTDNSIKVYVGWDGNQDKPDDVSHLMDLEEDGGYFHPYYPEVR